MQQAKAWLFFAGTFLPHSLQERTVKRQMCGWRPDGANKAARSSTKRHQLSFPSPLIQLARVTCRVIKKTIRRVRYPNGYEAYESYLQRFRGVHLLVCAQAYLTKTGADMHNLCESRCEELRPFSMLETALASPKPKTACEIQVRQLNLCRGNNSRHHRESLRLTTF